MAFIGIPKYERGQLVKISVDESQRLGVPKDRLWLVVQNNNVRDSLDVVVCLLTSREGKHGLTTDVEIDKGTLLSPGPPLSEDSYIRCSQLYSAKATDIEYFGTLPHDSSLMLLVDKMLVQLLGVEWLTVQESTAPVVTAPTPSRTGSWRGHKPGPVRKLPRKKS